MKIAVINEFSACAKNGDIVAALEAGVPGAQIMNAGMSDPAQQPQLVRDGALAHFQPLGQVEHAQRAGPQRGKDADARGVAEDLEQLRQVI
jgi:hypothetical protein